MRINREILRLSIPAIISNITVPLLGLADTTIAGHLKADSFIGAIAVGSMMINVTFWLFVFLRMGTTGITAQAFGANDASAIRRTFSRSFLLGFLIGLLILIFGIPIREFLLSVISPDKPVRTLASQYYSICIFSAPALLATTAIQGWLFGMQTTLFPMIISISVNLINIILSISLVFIFKTGFVGVAFGTLIANWAGLFLALILAARKSQGRLWCQWVDLWNASELKRFFSVNSDIFFRSFCIIAVSLSTTAIGARLGELTLATNAVMMQFFHLFSFFMDGFAFTAEALTGRFVGAANPAMVRQSRNALLKWSAAMALTFFFIYTFFSSDIVSLITDSPTVRANIVHYQIWLSLIPPLTVAAFIYDGFYIGMTATRQMLVATLTAAIIYFAICFIHPSGIALPSNNILWLAFIAYLILRGGILALWGIRIFSTKNILQISRFSTLNTPTQ